MDGQALREVNLIPDPGSLAGIVWVLGQLLLLSAAGTSIIRSVWPRIAPSLAQSIGLMAGPALFGAKTSFAMYVVPGSGGVAAGWVVVLGIAAAVAWRVRQSPVALLPGWRAVAFWFVSFLIALAARQQYWIPDAMVHAPLSASLMAGVFPPRFPWTPDVPAIYHFLPELLVGTLNLGFGPGLVLTTELLGAFVAAALAMLVAAVAAELGASRLAIALALPMLLSSGLWTLVLFADRPAAALVVIPVGTPEAGLRAALGSVFVPDVASAATSPAEAAPPNIINPHFTWSYGLAMSLALLATARATHLAAGGAVIALLLSALSAIDETVFVSALLALGAFSMFNVFRRRRTWQGQGYLLLALTAGTGLALGQGGVVSDLLFRAPGSMGVFSLHRPSPELVWLGEIQTVGGGLGTLTIGTVAILILGGGAAYIARSAALAIVVAMALTLFAGFALVRFPASPMDTARLEGHALNLAMMALAVGLAVLAVRIQHRVALYSSSLLLVGLVVWPTTADAFGRMAQAIANGPRLYIGGTRPVEYAPSFSTRSHLDAEVSDRRPLIEAVTAIVSPDKRILTARPKIISAGTGRPTPLGYAEWPHYVALPGPEYLDAMRSLDQAALRDLRIDFVHVDDAMLGGMSEEARRRLRSSEFKLVFRAPGPQLDELYAVVDQPPVARAPAPKSFRALAELAAGRRVLISSATHPIERLPLYYTLRANQHLYGRWDDPAHFRHDLQIRPPTGDAVDLLALPDTVYPAPLDPMHRAPVWMHEGLRVYDLGRPSSGGLPRSPIRVAGHSLLDESGIQITSAPGWSDDWTGTDWMVFREAEPNSGIPAILEKGQLWFPGQLAPKNPGQEIEIRFDASRGQLEQRRTDGGWSDLGDLDRVLPADSYVLTLRFTSEGRAVFFVPVAILELAEGAPLDRVFAQGNS